MEASLAHPNSRIQQYPQINGETEETLKMFHHKSNPQKIIPGWRHFFGYNP